MKSVLSRSTSHPAPSAKYTMCSCCTPALSEHTAHNASNCICLCTIVTRVAPRFDCSIPETNCVTVTCCHRCRATLLPLPANFRTFFTHHLITLHANCQAASATLLRTRQTHLLSCHRPIRLETTYNRCHEIDSTSRLQVGKFTRTAIHRDP